ncbi:MAG TPA: ABC transporter ATP-binding protein [Candidatus Polarisedimenticolaceae bacterium]|nr:ABC transporter ATP-binding protein [Candidatus Polarisedimenticolaceae bacterium]
MPASIITGRDIVKTFGKNENAFSALKGVSLDIKEGESIAIIGKSGSGKSTLMHLLALLDKPTGGSINVHGTDSAKMRGRTVETLRNQEFGFVFQQFFLNGNSTALENVVLPLKIAGVRARERRRRGIAALKLVQLEDKVKSKARDLSGGQKQRVVIARALINNPNVIFADEPTGNLDTVTGNHIVDMLFKLNKQGITLIIVTHDEDLAKHCSRQIRMKDGKVESRSLMR